MGEFADNHAYLDHWLLPHPRPRYRFALTHHLLPLQRVLSKLRPRLTHNVPTFCINGLYPRQNTTKPKTLTIGGALKGHVKPKRINGNDNR